MMAQEMAPRVPEVKLSDNLEKLESPVFTKRLTGYKQLFDRRDAKVRESQAINSSLAASTLTQRKKGPFQAELAVAIERRLRHPIKLVDYEQDIEQTAKAIEKKAKDCGLSASAGDFNLTALFECCLDQMGIADKSPGKSHPRDDKLFERINANMRYLDADPNQIKRDLSTFGKPVKPGSWEEEKDYIATHDSAIREIIASGSRPKALIVATLEDAKLEGSLTKFEGLIARILARKISGVAKACGYSPKDANIDMELVIRQQFLALMGTDVRIIPDSMSIREHLKALNTADTMDLIYGKRFLADELKGATEKLTDTKDSRRMSDKLGNLAIVAARVLSSPTPGAPPEYAQQVEIAKNNALIEMFKRIDGPYLLTLLGTPKFAEAVAYHLSQPTELLPEAAQAAHENLSFEILAAIGKTVEHDQPQIQKRILQLILKNRNPQFLQALQTFIDRDISKISTRNTTSNEIKAELSGHSLAEDAQEEAKELFINAGLNKRGEVVEPVDPAEIHVGIVNAAYVIEQIRIKVRVNDLHFEGQLPIGKQDILDLNRNKTLLFLYYGAFDLPSDVGSVIVETIGDEDPPKLRQLVLANPNYLLSDTSPKMVKHTLVDKNLLASTVYRTLPVEVSHAPEYERNNLPY